jgi:hypothetical protein
VTQSGDKDGSIMRALRTTFPLAVLILVGCQSTDGMLDKDEELSWGQPFEGSFDAVVNRAQSKLLQKFPLGLDPDRTNEDQGDLWTVWRYDISVMYRETTRNRARVKVEDMGEGKVRVGVAVMQQLNDNIDNPSVIDEAKWVRKHRVPDQEETLRAGIEQSWLRFEASTTWKEQNRAEKRTGMRPDLIDRADDVTLEDYKSKTIAPTPKITGSNETGSKATEYGSHTREKKKDDG